MRHWGAPSTGAPHVASTILTSDITLTFASAGAYVVAYHAEHGATVVVRSAVLKRVDGWESVDIAATVREADGSTSDAHWTVWLEGDALYGEF